jgi:membrane protease YdiL (CAAX protease family)
MRDEYTGRPRLTDEERFELRSDGNFVGGLVILVVVLLSFLFTGVVLTLMATGVLSAESMGLDDLGMGNTRYLLMYAGVYTASMGIPALVGCLMFRRSPFPLFASKRVPFGRVIATLLIGMGGCIAANIVASIVATFLESYGIPLPESPSFMEATPLSFVLNLLVLAVLPALLEEMIFRVCILGALRKYGDTFAIVVSALLFGFIHGGLSQSVFAVIVGLVLGYFVVTTGNVWLAVIIHFLNNAMSVVLEFVTLSMNDTQASFVNGLVMYPVAIIGAVTLLICIARRSPLLRRVDPAPCPFWKSLGTLWGSPLMIIGTVLVVLRIVQSFFN